MERRGVHYALFSDGSKSGHRVGSDVVTHDNLIQISLPKEGTVFGAELLVHGLRDRALFVEISLVPAHVGIGGNEEAGKFAKDACNQSMVTGILCKREAA